MSSVIIWCCRPIHSNNAVTFAYCGVEDGKRKDCLIIRKKRYRRNNKQRIRYTPAEMHLFMAIEYKNEFYFFYHSLSKESVVCKHNFVKRNENDDGKNKFSCIDTDSLCVLVEVFNIWVSCVLHVHSDKCLNYTFFSKFCILYLKNSKLIIRKQRNDVN